MTFLLLPLLVACGHLPAAPQAQRIKPGAVIYAAVPPLFGPDPLPAVIRRLDYLAELGVDVLLLSPIQATDDSSTIS